MNKKDKKIMVSSMFDENEVEIFNPLESDIDWVNLRENVESAINSGEKVVVIRVTLESKKWLESLPEYEG